MTCCYVLDTTACQNTTCDEDYGYCVENSDGSTECMCVPDYYVDPSDATKCIGKPI